MKIMKKNILFGVVCVALLTATSCSDFLDVQPEGDVFCKWSHLNDRNSRLSVFLSGENLATITRYSGMDPECGGWDALKYPVSRVFSLGVKLTY